MSQSNFFNIRFNRAEWGGSLGDIGTDLPLLVAMISAGQLDVASTLIMFGVMQILTGLSYGMPMPMQPLKAMAVIVIAQKVPSSLLYTAGFLIGIVMLLITSSGLLGKIQSIIPHHVVRGIQMGLAFSLIKIAFFNYIATSGIQGIFLAFISGIFYFLAKNKLKFPASFIFILAGIVYALGVKRADFSFLASPELHLPQIQFLQLDQLWPAFLTLVLPQLPLSLANSVIATHQTIGDLFPEKKISLKKIGFSYGLANIFAPFFSGIPLCHGCGGLAGHYGFGARTGGSVIIYGSFYLLLGLFFAHSFHEIISVFPYSILGMILFFEALVLLGLARDLIFSMPRLSLAFIVALICLFVPQGFFVGLMVGLVLTWVSRRFGYNL